MRLLVAVMALWMALPNVGAGADDGFVDLFNGKDLTGWEGDPTLWSVEDGAITGKTDGKLPYNKFLIWKDGTLTDFEVRLVFRLEGDNNSGVQYRSARLKDAGEYVVGGYQADIHANPPYTGMLYDERGRGILAERGQKVVVGADGKREITKLEGTVEAVDLTKWNELTIIGRGNHIVHKLNGQVAVDITDNQEKDRELEGVLALQVHAGPAMKAQFKSVKLKNLKPGKGAAAKPNAANVRRLAGMTQPKWIWDAKREGDNGKVTERVFFRKEFNQQGGIPSARLYVAADNKITVWIDGEKVLEHDGWTEAGSKDVTELFNKERPGGKHLIAIEGRNTGDDNPAGLFLSLAFESGWRDAWNIGTDDTWQATTKETSGWEQPDFKPEGWGKAVAIADLEGGPWKLTPEKLYAAAGLKMPTATPIDALKVAKGFQAELLYSVPKDKQGSWVNICTDPKGRLIVSDQYGGLYRVVVPPLGTTEGLTIEKIPVDLGEAQGLLWAFDSLYVMVNKGGKYTSGFYRVRDTNGDDQLDTVEFLRELTGGGEHGPHAILLAPDGQSLYVICGNQVKFTEVVGSRVPRIWDEDQLLPRIYGRGFMKGVAPPAGNIYKVTPDGKDWELITSGFRNQYDAAFNRAGELFTFDADMEWDMNCPWYRPTRVCHVLSGVDYGWRNGSAKWPVYYADTVPPVINIGPGSPTGVTFGYGAKFPAKYQNAFFISDWSYGKLYAVHLEPKGATYVATSEEFITGTPLPLTDVIVRPQDGAMYFAIGGRKVQSGLYRVTYTGPESTEPVTDVTPPAPEVAIRKSLEAFHGKVDPAAIDAAWKSLSHPDRVIRAAARTAIESQPVAAWQEKALAETNPQASLTALVGLVRMFPRVFKPEGPELDTPPPAYPVENLTLNPLLPKVLEALGRLDWSKLSYEQKMELCRAYTLALYRLGPVDEATRTGVTAKLDSLYPAQGRELNVMLTEMLVYLQSPTVAEKGTKLLAVAPTQEEQIDLARSLRFLTAGWTMELRKSYMEWFVKGLAYKGGANFAQFMQELKGDAVARIPEDQKKELAAIIEAVPPAQTTPISVTPRPFVKEWKMEEVAPLVEGKLTGRDFDKGRALFAAANCFGCHRFSDEGGSVGPDLTGLAGRFSRRDILESVMEPSKVISDQYAAVQIVTLDGKVVVGRIMNLAGDVLQINTNMLDPSAITPVDRKTIDEMEISKTSMMPTGLLNSCNEEELLDLMAYLLSRGDRAAPFFRK
ncbi:family 16 glycoside hydrolase [Planctomyces sp. SH-PL14]|uniref:family 16 glycoside hydrolase n=1 Tax=Planctomyces sp. SH-PL14 TaxID=1632864 RepID=UPI00078B1A07|nr:family 16 glycoside hydrolase [Planctomyces sp. SH-PL14]AMV17005.1 Cytochrome c [Planctomyces sp. SH-PL14]